MKKSITKSIAVCFMMLLSLWGAEAQNVVLVNSTFQDWTTSPTSGITGTSPTVNTSGDGTTNFYINGATLLFKGTSYNSSSAPGSATLVASPNYFRFGTNMSPLFTAAWPGGTAVTMTNQYLKITPSSNFNKGGKITLTVSCTSTGGTVQVGDILSNSLLGDYTIPSTNTRTDYVITLPSNFSGNRSIAIGRKSVTFFLHAIKIETYPTNEIPTFKTTSPSITLCQDATAFDFKSIMHVSDADANQTETWTQSVAPTHGTLTINNATASSGSSDITPGGTMSYQPNAGYIGTDAFTIQLSDGTETVTKVVNVTVNGNVSIGTQPVGATYNQNDLATALSISASNGTGYQWYSNDSQSTSGATLLTDQTASTYTPSTATPGTKWYYCVVNGCTPLTSNIVSVLVNAVTILNAPAISDATDATNQGFTAHWAGVDHASSYILNVYDGTNTKVKTISNILTTSTLITGLTANTSYTYKVLSVGDGVTYGNSSESSASNPVRTLNTEKAITAFTITGQVSSNIDEGSKTITVFVPSGTDKSNLTSSTITVSSHAGVSPAQGVTIDYTSPVTYTVTAEDGSTQDYTVTVSFATASTDYFQSKTTGIWSDNTTWQSSGTGNAPWMDATSAPTSSAAGVTIISGHTVTVNATSTIPATTVATGATLKATAQITLGTTLTVNGTYEHAMNGGNIPISVWNNESLLLIDGITGSIPTGIDQDFYNFTWNCTSQSADIGGIWSDARHIKGNVTITGTGTKYLRLMSMTAGVTKTLTIDGNLVLNGGLLTSNGSSAAGASVINIGGNLSVGTGSTLLFNNGSGASPCTINLTGNFLINGGTLSSKSASDNVTINFIGGVQTYTNTGTFNTSLSATTINVNGGSTLDIASQTIGGLLIFNLKSNAKLKTSHVNGVSGNFTTSGTKTFNPNSSFEFYGTETNAVTGANMPQSVKDVTITNSNGVSLSNDLTITGSLVTNSTVKLNSKILTINGNLQINNGGSIDAAPVYGSASTLIYNTGGTYGRWKELDSSTPANLQLSNNTTLNYPNGAIVERTFSGNLTIDAGSALYMDYSISGVNLPLRVNGNVTLNGNLSLGNAAGGDLYVGGNWSTGVGSNLYANSRAVLFNGTSEQTINNAGGASFPYMFIRPGAKVTLPVDNSLTVSNLTIESSSENGTGTLINKGTLTNTNATVNQSFQHAGALRTWYVTPPVASATPSGMSIIKSYDETSYSWSANTTTMLAKVGYQVVPAAAANDIAFNGVLNSGDQTITLTGRTGFANKPGFNLVGNPYPAYLNWDLVTASTPNSNSMRTTTMWYRTKSEGAYSFWTVNGDGVAVPNNASKYIPPVQAFWVRAVEGGGSLALTSDMTSHAPATDKLLKAPAAVQSALQLLRLQVSNGTYSDEAVIYFSAKASNDLDKIDAPKMSNENPSIPEIYTTLGTEHIVINAMNSIPTDQPIGLGFVPGSATSFSIKASEVSNLPSDVKVILKDNVTLIETDLTDGTASYQFSPETTVGDRFSVIFRSSSTTTALNNNNVNGTQIYWNNQQGLTLRTGDDKLIGSVLSVYNAVGQQLLSKKISGTTMNIEFPYAPDIYIVKINNITAKVIVK